MYVIGEYSHMNIYTLSETVQEQACMVSLHSDAIWFMPFATPRHAGVHIMLLTIRLAHKVCCGGKQGSYPS
jgi:hypothetical protein